MAIVVRENVRIFFETLDPELKRKTKPVLLEAARIAWRNVVAETKRTFKGGTGNLARSFAPKIITDRGGEKRAAVVSDSRYAEIQNSGGTIRPKGNFLAIPIGNVAKRTRAWPRSWPKGSLFKFKNRRGNWLLAQTGKKAGDRDFLQYLLRKSVTIPGTGYLDAAAVKSEEAIGKLFKSEIQSIIEKTEAKV